MALKLQINKLSFVYGNFKALKDVLFEVDRCEFLGVVGPNGSGKSTLLKCIGRILRPEKNAVLIDDCDVTKINLKSLAKVMGYVPQRSESVFPFTVFDIVLMGRKPYIHWTVSDDDCRIAIEALKYLGLEDLATRHFNELSGGEQQKVIIARALAQQPRILLFDEPTTYLDIRHQLEILDLLKHLTTTKQCTVIVAMHDLNLASRYADRILMLKKGSIYALGPPETVLSEENIADVYGIKVHVTRTILGAMQIMPVEPVGTHYRRSEVPIKSPPKQLVGP